MPSSLRVLRVARVLFPCFVRDFERAVFCFARVAVLWVELRRAVLLVVLLRRFVLLLVLFVLLRRVVRLPVLLRRVVSLSVLPRREALLRARLFLPCSLELREVRRLREVFLLPCEAREVEVRELFLLLCESRESFF